MAGNARAPVPATVYPLPPLHDGRILDRYKRFFALVELAGGERVTAHCPNTGTMRACWAPGRPAQVSFSDDPRRKLAWTLERVDMGRGWVGVHTGRPNHVVAWAIREGLIGPLGGYEEIRLEPAFDSARFPRSRFDIRLRAAGRPDAYVEIKNTTYLEGDSVMFPDAVTERGRKHLELLAQARAAGHRAVLVFAVNRPEGRHFEPAHAIDPDYGERLEAVAGQGVEIVVVRLAHAPAGIGIAGCAVFRG